MSFPKSSAFTGLRHSCVAAGMLILAACAQEPKPKDIASEAVADTQTQDTKELNLYSSRHYDTDLALYSDFEAATGIKINRIEASADALIERISREGEFSPADILITVDAGRLWRAEQADIFAPVDSDVLSVNLPENMRHPDGLWFGLSKRARVMIYNSTRIDTPPLSYADLAKDDYAGEVCIRSSSNIYNISLMASFIANEGQGWAEQWARDVVDNFARAPQGNDTAQIKAVASGECGIALVNSYYLARLSASDEPSDQDIFNAVTIVFPDQDGRGTHVNISGAGVLKTAPNRDNAIKFLEYLTTDAAQSYFANGNHEYPAVAQVESTSALAKMGAFKEDRLNASALGQFQSEAVKVFDRADWR